MGEINTIEIILIINMASILLLPLLAWVIAYSPSEYSPSEIK